MIIKVWNWICKTAVYLKSGVWNDNSNSLVVRLLKTINLAVNSFLDRNLQLRSMSLTYSTVLALVPAIALLVAIARGFGLQNILQDELYSIFPSQHKVISTSLQFVDSYLTSATQGVFVGVGILVLLWSIISLLSSIEDSFNMIWDVSEQRSLWQKLSDYIAICLIIPVLMICSSGISIFMISTIQNSLILPFITPLLNIILEATPFILSWLAFSLSFALIPNIKVKFRYASISGAICALGFQLLQYLFLSGQIYVSKYNAIYGSFAFLPLLLVWLQLSWMLLLAGCVLTYSLQNVFSYRLLGDYDKFSNNSRQMIALIVMSAVAKRFSTGLKPFTQAEITKTYNLPVRVVGRFIDIFERIGLIYKVNLSGGEYGISPAMEMENMNIGRFFEILNNYGDNTFLSDLNINYPQLENIILPMQIKSIESYSEIKLRDLPI